MLQLRPCNAPASEALIRAPAFSRKFKRRRSVISSVDASFDASRNVSAYLIRRCLTQNERPPAIMPKEQPDHLMRRLNNGSFKPLTESKVLRTPSHFRKKIDILHYGRTGLALMIAKVRPPEWVTTVGYCGSGRCNRRRRGILLKTHDFRL